MKPFDRQMQTLLYILAVRFRGDVMARKLRTEPQSIRPCCPIIVACRGGAIFDFLFRRGRDQPLPGPKPLLVYVAARDRRANELTHGHLSSL